MEVEKKIYVNVKMTEKEAKVLFDFTNNYLEGEEHLIRERHKEILRKIYDKVGNKFM